jgi:hypothetical protein
LNPEISLKFLESGDDIKGRNHKREEVQTAKSVTGNGVKIPAFPSLKPLTPARTPGKIQKKEITSWQLQTSP